MHEPCTVHVQMSAGLPVEWKQQQTQKKTCWLNSALDAGNAERNWWQRSPKIKPPHYHGLCTIMVENTTCTGFCFFKTKGSIKLPAPRGSGLNSGPNQMCAPLRGIGPNNKGFFFSETQKLKHTWMQISRYFFLSCNCLCPLTRALRTPLWPFSWKLKKYWTKIFFTL